MQAVISKRLISRLVLVLVGISLILQLCSCGKTQEIKEYSVPETSVSESGVVAQNDNYTLSWDAEESCLLLKDNKSGYIWSSVPYDFYLQKEGNVNLSSPLFIEYYSPEDGSLQTAKAYSDCMEEGNYSVSAIDGGIRMTFHFIDAEASLSLDFVLRDDSLAVSMPFSEIKESGRTKLIRVSFLPYFCSAPNTDDKSSYLFVPSGSGALMYTDEDIQNVSRYYAGSVYGRDKASVYLDNSGEETAVKMPVYGVTAKDNSLMAIIESGDGSALINAEAGNFRNGYSAVYSTVVLRGSDETEAERNNYTDVEIYAESFDKNAIYTVGYYPLSGENSGYNGMAKRYKQYLSDKGMISGKEKESADYHIKLLGGSVTKKFFLGFPYYSLTSATTFSQAEEIIKALSEASGKAPSVTLSGFGKSGVDAGEIAGGISFESDFGGKRGYKALAEYCNKSNIDLFFDFDALYFSKSGKGVSKQLDTAKTPGRQAAAFYPSTVSLRTDNESLKKVRLLKRSRLDEVADKVLKFSNKNISGVSLASLSSAAYSDYSDEVYYVKGGIAKQFSEIIKKFKKNGHSVAGSGANGFAAALCDTVYDAPLDNGGYVNLDVTVPFYSMVFGESTALYSSALNLSEDSEELLLRGIEAGICPSFTLIAEYDEKLSDSAYFDFYGTDFESQRENILNVLEKTKAYRKAVSGQYPLSHRIITQGVTETVFSEGTRVLVNFNENEESAGNINIPARGFVCIQ